MFRPLFLAVLVAFAACSEAARRPVFPQVRGDAPARPARAIAHTHECAGPPALHRALRPALERADRHRRLHRRRRRVLGGDPRQPDEKGPGAGTTSAACPDASSSTGPTAGTLRAGPAPTGPTDSPILGVTPRNGQNCTLRARKTISVTLHLFDA